jgi:hypothetical protein
MGEYANKESEAKFSDEIQTKFSGIFLLYSFDFRILFLLTHATSYNFYSSVYTVKEEGGKPVRKSYPLPYGLRSLCRNLKSVSLRTLTNMPRNFNEIVRS